MRVVPFPAGSFRVTRTHLLCIIVACVRLVQWREEGGGGGGLKLIADRPNRWSVMSESRMGWEWKDGMDVGRFGLAAKRRSMQTRDSGSSRLLFSCQCCLVSRTATSTFTQLMSSQKLLVECCLTCTEIIRLIRDEEPRAAISTFTQLRELWKLLVECCLTCTETIRLIRDGSPGRPPRLLHSSRELWRLRFLGFFLQPRFQVQSLTKLKTPKIENLETSSVKVSRSVTKLKTVKVENLETSSVKVSRF